MSRAASAVVAVDAGRARVGDALGGEAHHDQGDRGERDHQQQTQLLPDAEPREHCHFLGVGPRPAWTRCSASTISRAEASEPTDRSSAGIAPKRWRRSPARSTGEHQPQQREADQADRRSRRPR